MAKTTRRFGIMCKYTGPTVNAPRGWRPWSWFSNQSERDKALIRVKEQWSEFYLFRRRNRKVTQ